MLQAFYKAYCDKCKKETRHYLGGGCAEEITDYKITITNNIDTEWINIKNKNSYWDLHGGIVK
jgi:hypothetical protein